MTGDSAYVLGVSAFYHDSAACLVRDGEIVAAAQEERFTRRRHDAAFPTLSVRYCLDAGQITVRDLESVVFYERPQLKFDRLTETYLSFAPAGFKSFYHAMRSWLGKKLHLEEIVAEELMRLGGLRSTSELPPLLLSSHHASHVASAFYPSPFDRAAVLCMDGVGEWVTTSGWRGEGGEFEPLWEIGFPHSLGMLYSAFTQHAGFRVNSGEYKLMGLAPFGEPRYVQAIDDHVVDLKADGSYKLNLEFFDYCVGSTMTSARFGELFGGRARLPEEPVTQRDMDLACSIQIVTDEIVLRLARTLYHQTTLPNLCLAGGVALNCVTNGRLLREGPFERIWVQPAAGDAGGAVGAALIGWQEGRTKGQRARRRTDGDGMSGALLGPRFDNDDVERYLTGVGAHAERCTESELIELVVRALCEQKVVGWFHGRMEFGPRALGARSILADARSETMQRTLNLKIKYRESFRPFAPAVLRESVSEHFDLDGDSPYMLFVADVRKERWRPEAESTSQLGGLQRVQVPRSDCPAVTHVDHSARVQTVSARTNPRFHKVLRAFADRTGCALVVNTSFNVRGEPIVCSPEDAYRCFMRTEMDLLVLEDFVVRKSGHSQVVNDGWRERIPLD